jgi:hypothetical protein
MRARGERLPAGGDDEVLSCRAGTAFRWGYSSCQEPPPMRKAKGPVGWGLDPSSRLGAWIPAQRSQPALHHDAEAAMYEERSTAYR